MTNTDDYFPADEEPAGPRYTTRRDAIEQAIMPALAEGDYDYESICYAAFNWAIDVDDQGRELLNTGGFEQTVTDDEFWEIVAQHEIT